MFKDFKPVLFILLRFAIIYLVLFLLYQFYLNRSEVFGLDYFSQWVAKQVAAVQNFFGFTTTTQHLPEYKTERFIVNGEIVSRMVEGCNAASVMILFAAFVLAFYKGFKTIIFVIFGLFFLHVMNVARIVGLNIVLKNYAEYGKIAHDYLFPAFIYGIVVILWLVWIKFFAIRNHENS